MKASTGIFLGVRNKGSTWCGGVTRCSLVDGFEMDLTSDSVTEAEVPQSAKGVFPGGFRRAEVRLPGLVLRVSLEDMQNQEKNVLLEEISAAVTGGVTMIVLEAGGDGGLGGAKLYDAGCMLKSLLRGRAELLIAERVDIAAASGADGVLLSDEGLFFFSTCVLSLECARFLLILQSLGARCLRSSSHIAGLKATSSKSDTLFAESS